MAYTCPSEKASSDKSNKEFHLKNPRIKREEEDILYHLALGNKSHNLVEMFGDVKFVCMGGTPHRMEKFAYYILQEIGYKICPGTMLKDLSINSHRYALFKVGPVLSVSHGMGMPSISILLHELIKLMYHAGVKNPLFFRLGTCGGLGVEPGSVVITTEALNGELKPIYKMAILGKAIDRPAILDQGLAQQIIQLTLPCDDFKIVAGKTMSTDDFYEGQGRLDGAFCHFTEDDKFDFLNHAKNQGVTNIEMEALALAAITHHVGIKTAVICVTLLDRLKGDQIQQSKKTLLEWQDRPMVVMARFIKKHLRENPDILKMLTTNKSNSCPECVDDTSAASYKLISPMSTISEAKCNTNCSSIVVSSRTHLQRVLNESNSVE